MSDTYGEFIDPGFEPGNPRDRDMQHYRRVISGTMVRAAASEAAVAGDSRIENWFGDSVPGKLAPFLSMLLNMPAISRFVGGSSQDMSAGFSEGVRIVPGMGGKYIESEALGKQLASLAEKNFFVGAGLHGPDGANRSDIGRIAALYGQRGGFEEFVEAASPFRYTSSSEDIYRMENDIARRNPDGMGTEALRQHLQDLRRDNAEGVYDSEVYGAVFSDGVDERFKTMFSNFKKAVKTAQVVLKSQDLAEAANLLDTLSGTNAALNPEVAAQTVARLGRIQDIAGVTGMDTVALVRGQLRTQNYLEQAFGDPAISATLSEDLFWSTMTSGEESARLLKRTGATGLSAPSGEEMRMLFSAGLADQAKQSPMLSTAMYWYGAFASDKGRKRFDAVQEEMMAADTVQEKNHILESFITETARDTTLSNNGTSIAKAVDTAGTGLEAADRIATMEDKAKLGRLYKDMMGAEIRANADPYLYEALLKNPAALEDAAWLTDAAQRIEEATGLRPGVKEVGRMVGMSTEQRAAAVGDLGMPASALPAVSEILDGVAQQRKERDDRVGTAVGWLREHTRSAGTQAAAAVDIPKLAGLEQPEQRKQLLDMGIAPADVGDILTGLEKFSGLANERDAQAQKAAGKLSGISGEEYTKQTFLELSILPREEQEDAIRDLPGVKRSSRGRVGRLVGKVSGKGDKANRAASDIFDTIQEAAASAEAEAMPSLDIAQLAGLPRHLQRERLRKIGVAQEDINDVLGRVDKFSELDKERSARALSAAETLSDITGYDYGKDAVLELAALPRDEQLRAVGSLRGVDSFNRSAALGLIGKVAGKSPAVERAEYKAAKAIEDKASPENVPEIAGTTAMELAAMPYMDRVGALRDLGISGEEADEASRMLWLLGDKQPEKQRESAERMSATRALTAAGVGWKSPERVDIIADMSTEDRKKALGELGVADEDMEETARVFSRYGGQRQTRREIMGLREKAQGLIEDYTGKKMAAGDMEELAAMSPERRSVSLDEMGLEGAQVSEVGDLLGEAANKRETDTHKRMATLESQYNAAAKLVEPSTLRDLTKIARVGDTEQLRSRIAALKFTDAESATLEESVIGLAGSTDEGTMEALFIEQGRELRMNSGPDSRETQLKTSRAATAAWSDELLKGYKGYRETAGENFLEGLLTRPGKLTERDYRAFAAESAVPELKFDGKDKYTVQAGGLLESEFGLEAGAVMSLDDVTELRSKMETKGYSFGVQDVDVDKNTSTLSIVTKDAVDEGKRLIGSKYLDELLGATPEQAAEGGKRLTRLGKLAYRETVSNQKVTDYLEDVVDVSDKKFSVVKQRLVAAGGADDKQTQEYLDLIQSRIGVAVSTKRQEIGEMSEHAWGRKKAEKELARFEDMYGMLKGRDGSGIKEEPIPDMNIGNILQNIFEFMKAHVATGGG